MATAAPAASDGRSRLDYFIHHIKSFQGDFYQQVIDEKGELVQEARGQVALKKPGRFRWNYEEPFQQQIVADGTNLWLFDQELSQATVEPLKDALGSAPIMLLTEAVDLDREFEIVDRPRDLGLEWVLLRPRVQDTEFDLIELGLDEHGVREMKLHDHFSQQTIIRFSQLQYNTDLPNSYFRFDIPENVDVIGTPQ